MYGRTCWLRGRGLGENVCVEGVSGAGGLVRWCVWKLYCTVLLAFLFDWVLF